MADGSVPLLVAIFILIILSGLFSATETAYTGLNVIKVKSLQEKNVKLKRVLALYDNYDKLITTILIGNNIVNITASSLSLIFFQKNISNFDPAFLSTIALTVMILLFGELIPKFIGKSNPEKIATLNYPFIILFYYIFFPLNILFELLKKGFCKIFKIKVEEVITDEELITIVNEAEEDGTLKEEESDLIKSAIEFDDLEVSDILIPRINVVAIPTTATKDEILETLQKEGYSRLPVYDNNIDSIVGIIHEKDFYKTFQNDDFNLKDIMQEVIFVVEHTKISTLLKKLKSKKVHMAVVLDEYGGTLGIVTMEDIIEELVGEIYDEYDEEGPSIKEGKNSTYIVNGLTEIDTFFEYFELPKDEEIESNTVGGWITEKLGDLPQVGKVINYENLKIEVTKTTNKKIVELVVRKVQTNEE